MAAIAFAWFEVGETIVPGEVATVTLSLQACCDGVGQTARERPYRPRHQGSAATDEHARQPVAEESSAGPE